MSRALAREGGLVIACGGGLPTRAEAIAALKASGVVFWLNREPALIYDTVSMAHRPLGQGGKEAFLERFRQREPIYRQWSDHFIAEPTPEAAAARVRQAEGAVSEVESYISDAMVYSPVTGEISTIIAEEGELVGSGYPVVAILDMSDLWVTFNVKETLLPGLRIGTRMNGYVPALDSDVEFEVTYISPQADFATWSATRTQGGFDIRTFAIKAKAVTEAANMRPGMSVLVDWDQIGK